MGYDLKCPTKNRYAEKVLRIFMVLKSKHVTPPQVY